MTKDKIISAEERYKSLFHIQANRLNGSKEKAFFKVKKAAIDQLGEISFPNRKNEDWKYTNLTRLLKTPYEDVSNTTEVTSNSPTILENAFSIRCINGVISYQNSDLELLENEADIFTIEQALHVPEFQNTIREALNSIITESETGFELLNLAFVQKGLVIRVKKDTSLSKPIQLIYETQGIEDGSMISHLLMVFVEAGAKATIVEANIGPVSPINYFKNVQNRFHLDRNAHLSYFKVQDEGEMGHLIHHTVIKQDQASTFTSLHVDTGGKLVRNNIYAEHLSDSITTNLNGVYLAIGERQHIDNQTFIDHAYPHCQSNELYKGIIDQHSKAIFNGKVIVQPDAQKINAFQQNANLVLSDQAEVNTKPQLEIFADDVRCSHGATIGQLDPQALYYLRTRGLSKSAAEDLLKKAFLDEVFNLFEGEDVVIRINHWLKQKMENL